MNEIDWGKAPEGATHYNHTCFDWYKVGSHEPSFWNGRAWAPARFWDDRKHDCIQRPTTPLWSGEGLPPVGVDCEFRHKGTRGGWIKCHVVGYHLGHLYGYCPEHEWFMRKHDGVCHLRLDDSVKFRTIRTPEQIAADEREAAIDEMLAATPAPGSDISLRVCEQLYDAGYRKP